MHSNPRAHEPAGASVAISAFPELAGTAWLVEPFGAGRIHETWALRPDRQAGEAGEPGQADEPDAARTPGEPAYLMQRFNTRVFPDYRGLMANVALVTDLLDTPLRFLATAAGALYHEHEGAVWRAMPFIAGSEPVPVPATAEQAAEAAHAYGSFAAGLASLDPGRLVEVIPGFHDTPSRYRALVAALRAPGPSGGSEQELAGFVEARAGGLGFVAERLVSGELPRRVCHNDAKADNVLLDRRTGKARCVVDLDTVMAGSPLYDLGDLLRSAGASVGEDEPRAELVGVRWECARAILDGFVAGAGTALTGVERRLAPASGWLLAMEQAIRYLTDHVLGDVYYRVEYAGQNLDRARNQAALAVAYEERGWALSAGRRRR